MEAVPATPAGGAAVAVLPSAAAAASDAGAHVAPPALVRRVEILGSTLPESVTARLRARFVGRPLDAATGARAAAALQAAYARADIQLAQVGGPLLGADGALTLGVLEGRLEGIDVEGGTPRGRRLAHHYLRRLLREAPLTRSGFERATALVALTPGVKASFDFTVTATPGLLRLKVGLHSVRARFDLKITNRGAVTFGAWQGRADARAFSVLKGGDEAVLTVGATPDARQLRLISGTYLLPIGWRGATVAFSVAHVEAEPYRSGLASDGTSVRAALAYPLDLRWDRSLSGVLVADGLDGQNTAGTVTTDDERTRNLRAGLIGSRLWGKESGVGGVFLTQGLDVAGARAAHPGYAPTSYTKVYAYGGLATPYGPWTVRLHAGGQLAGSRLPSSEQFTVGGDDYGRGYQAISLQGDEGIAGSAELAMKIHRGMPSIFAGSELFTYVDGGGVRVQPRAGIRGGDGSLMSAGFGARIGVGNAAGFELSADRGLHLYDPLTGRRDTGWRFGVRLHVAWAPGADAVIRPTDLAGAAPFNPLPQ